MAVPIAAIVKAGDVKVLLDQNGTIPVESSCFFVISREVLSETEKRAHGRTDCLSAGRGPTESNRARLFVEMLKKV